jgi:hypothetical protein
MGMVVLHSGLQAPFIGPYAGARYMLMCGLFGIQIMYVDGFSLIGKNVSIAMQFSRKKVNPDGSMSDKYLINEEFIAMIDYLFASSLWTSVGDVRKMQSFYAERVALYKNFNGAEGRREWRKEIVSVLENFIHRFPDVVTRGGGTIFHDAARETDLEVEQVNIPPDML